MILNLTYTEMDLLVRAIQLKRETYQVSDRDDDHALLNDLEARIDAICRQTAEAEATAWQVEIQNDKGRRKHWYRTVEIRIFSEVLYVFRVRAEDLFKPNDPITDHYVVIGKREYRTTQPAPAEIHLKALIALRGISAWMSSLELTEDLMRRDWGNA